MTEKTRFIPNLTGMLIERIDYLIKTEDFARLPYCLSISKDLTPDLAIYTFCAVTEAGKTQALLESTINQPISFIGENKIPLKNLFTSFNSSDEGKKELFEIYDIMKEKSVDYQARRDFAITQKATENNRQK